MKKQILNLGKALNRAEQKEIKGGNDYYTKPGDCWRVCGKGCVFREEEWVCI